MRSSRCSLAEVFCFALFSSASAQEPAPRPVEQKNLVLFASAAEWTNEALWERCEIRSSAASGTRRRLSFRAEPVATALREHSGGTASRAEPLRYPAGALFVAEDLDAQGETQRTEVLEIGAQGVPAFQVYGAGGAAEAFDAQRCAECHVAERRFEPWQSFPRESEEQQVAIPDGARAATACALLAEAQRRGAPTIAPYGALLLGALEERVRRGALREGELPRYAALRARWPELLLHDPAHPPHAQPAPEARVRDLVQALERHLADPLDEEALIWAGRRLAYLGRFEEALRLYTQGLADHPRSAELLRHRGHRYLSTRRFENAVADLERAREIAFAAPDKVEPDGAPNAQGIPLTTLRSNVLYHLALAHYLRGDWLRAKEMWSADLAMASNDDRRCSAGAWLWAAARRCGDEEAARAALSSIRPDTAVLENFSYLDVLRHRRGELGEAELLERHASATALASAGYGLAETWRAEGRTAEARALLERIVENAPPAAFGTLAAEVELARLRAAEKR